MPDQCQLCRRRVAELTTHHLIPRARHGNKRNRKQFDREDVRTRTIDVCRPCHKNIHAVLTNKELEREYNTLEALKSHPDIDRFIRWVASKPDSHVTVRSRNR
jgi:hypothetical protein